MKTYNDIVRRIVALQAVVAHTNSVAESIDAAAAVAKAGGKESSATEVFQRPAKEIRAGFEVLDGQLHELLTEYASELSGMLPPAIEAILQAGLADQDSVPGEALTTAEADAIAAAEQREPGEPGKPLPSFEEQWDRTYAKYAEPAGGLDVEAAGESLAKVTEELGAEPAAEPSPVIEVKPEGATILIEAAVQPNIRRMIERLAGVQRRTPAAVEMLGRRLGEAIDSFTAGIMIESLLLKLERMETDLPSRSDQPDTLLGHPIKEVDSSEFAGLDIQLGKPVGEEMLNDPGMNAAGWTYSERAEMARKCIEWLDGVGGSHSKPVNVITAACALLMIKPEPKPKPIPLDSVAFGLKFDRSKFEEARKKSQKILLSIWVNSEFRSAVGKVCSKPETQGLLKVGHERGDDLGEVLARVVSSVVCEIAGVELGE